MSRHRVISHALITVGLTFSTAACSEERSTITTSPSPLAQLSGEDGDVYQLVLVPGGITWSEALSAAIAMGGHLATVTSEAENTLLVDRFDTAVDGFVWIGASDREEEGVWRWQAGPERGSLLAYANWGSMEPNNAGDEDVAALNLGPLSPGGTATGEWGDTRTTVLFPGYIVEYSVCRGGPDDVPIVDAVLLPGDPVPVGAEITIGGSFRDLCHLDTHSAEIAWGDGTASAGMITEAAGAGTVAASHTYAAPGVYTITLTINDGVASGNRSSAHDVPAYLVVFDPSAGFVTGGGWIDSPSNACRWQGCERDGSTIGKATFGFTSRYQKGASSPSGHTAFHFAAGDLRFTSASYEWLVIAGAKAQFKGVGTINGSNDIGFLLTAMDGALLGEGEPDRFRIKLWDRVSGAILYDNVDGAQKELDAVPMAIGAGNIVIRQK